MQHFTRLLRNQSAKFLKDGFIVTDPQNIRYIPGIHRDHYHHRHHHYYHHYHSILLHLFLIASRFLLLNIFCLTDPTEPYSVDPTEPYSVDPSDPVNLAISNVPPGPAIIAGPADPVDPAGPADPADSTDQIDSSDPNNPTDVTDLTDPTDLI
jgi:hypothetical protein